MNIKPNIGLLNALIRITLGFTLLAWSTAKLTKQPWRDSFLLVALCGAMKVAEGIVRFCPITALCDRWQDMVLEHHETNDSQDDLEGIDGEAVLPYNPT